MLNKMQILNEIFEMSPVHKKVNNEQYRIRCPICGDSKKDPKDSHCYIKCSDDPNEPLLYNCFLCNSHGMVNKYFLEQLGVDKKFINEIGNQKYNRIPSIKKTDIDIVTGEPKMNSPQVKYIEDRLGTGFTYEDYNRFKIIWSMGSVSKFITDERVLNTLPNNRNSISFLSDDKTVMFNRTFLSSEHEHQWRKIRIIPGSKYSYYIIKTSLDLFTKDTLVLNIAEGIFDIISVYKNFNDGPNSIFLAAMGSDYISALDFALAKGFIGSNVVVKIYIDQGIDESILNKRLKNYKWLFDSIYVYKNIIGKDVGERMEKIKLEERRI